MIRIHSQTQLTLEGFETPFERSMDKNNRWIKLSACIPWDDLANAYYQSFNASTGRPAKDAQLQNLNGVSPNWLAKRLMNAYNNKGVFSNLYDSAEGLKRELEDRFSDVSVEVVGCVALFSARKLI